MDTQARIIAESISQFMKYGARSVTMDSIATALGISKKTLYQYFKDKDELVWAAIEDSVTDHNCTFHNIREEAADPIDHMLRANRYFNESLACVNPILFSDLQKYYPTAWKHFKAFRDSHMTEDILANLHEGKQRGLYRADINVELTCRIYAGIVDMVFDPESFPIDQFTRLEVRQESITIYLYGIATDQGRNLIDLYTSLKKAS